jgi:hypothetical protein
MTDRELLELAAKAVGIEIKWMTVVHTGEEFSAGWNPITDDGDALRLAVKLRLHVSVFADAIGIGTPGDGYTETKWRGDPYAATRRAITRAAAEIGKTLDK